MGVTSLYGTSRTLHTTVDFSYTKLYFLGSASKGQTRVVVAQRFSPRADPRDKKGREAKREPIEREKGESQGERFCHKRAGNYIKGTAVRHTVIT